MKKISLKNLNLSGVEKLSNDQLRGVLGGFSGSGSGDNDCPPECTGSCSTSDGKGNCVKGNVHCRCAIVG